METVEKIRETLTFQIGTEHYWQVFPNNDTYKITDGVKVMAEMCEAFWLVTDIFAWQCNPKVKKEPFQVWKLSLNIDQNKGALLVGEDGNGVKLARQEILYTDFPLPEGIMLYLDNGVLLLPSEY